MGSQRSSLVKRRCIYKLIIKDARVKLMYEVYDQRANNLDVKSKTYDIKK